VRKNGGVQEGGEQRLGRGICGCLLPACAKGALVACALELARALAWPHESCVGAAHRLLLAHRAQVEVRSTRCCHPHAPDLLPDGVLPLPLHL